MSSARWSCAVVTGLVLGVGTCLLAAEQPLTDKREDPADVPARVVQTAKGPALEVGGTMSTKDAETIPVEKVLANPQEYNKKVIRVEGVVSQVCTEQGCWLMLSDSKTGERTIWVKFAEPKERLAPLDSPGHRAVVEGKFVYGKVSEAFARHVREDAGDSPEKVEQIKGPQPMMIVREPAVARIYGVGPAPKEDVSNRGGPHDKSEGEKKSEQKGSTTPSKE